MNSDPRTPGIASRPHQAAPGEQLWQIRTQGYTYSAQLILRGQYGVEVQLFRNAIFLWGHRFDTREQAEQFAATERIRLEQEK